MAGRLAPAAQAQRAAVLAAALTAGFPPFVAYSAMARGYPLAAAALQLAAGDARRRWLIALFVGTAGGLATVPVSVMVVAGGWFWLAAVVTLRRAWSWALVFRLGVVGVAAAAVVGSIYLPIREQPGFDYDWLPDRSLRMIADLVETAWSTGWGTVGIVAVLAFAVLGVVRGGEGALQRRLPPIYLLSIGLGIAAGGAVPPLAALLLPLAAIGIVALIERLPERSPQLATVGVLAALLVVTPAWGMTRAAWDEDPPRVEDFDAVQALQR